MKSSFKLISYFCTQTKFIGNMKKQLLTIVIAMMAMLCAQANDTVPPVITNDTFWKTTSGSYIYSQGGGIFRFPDAQGVEHYYWYGVKYQEAVDYCPKALAGSKRTYPVPTSLHKHIYAVGLQR